MTDRYKGKTLGEVAKTNLAIAHGLRGVSVFVKNPGEADYLPGRKYAEGLNLSQILRTHAELNMAIIIDDNNYCGESVFRVVMPA